MPARALERSCAHACDELVVKPAVGAGSRDTRRHARTARAEILAHMGSLLRGRRSVLLQPYLSGVDADGETALMYFAGRFSHAIRKGPLLRPGAAATTALFAPEDISARAPGPDELAVGGAHPRAAAVRLAAVRAHRPDPRHRRCPMPARARAVRAIAVLWPCSRLGGTLRARRAGQAVASLKRGRPGTARQLRETPRTK